MDRVEWQRRIDEAMPHGPDEPCTCGGCWACLGHVMGCTCDIAWDTAAELERDGWSDA